MRSLVILVAISATAFAWPDSDKPEWQSNSKWQWGPDQQWGPSQQQWGQQWGQQWNPSWQNWQWQQPPWWQQSQWQNKQWQPNWQSWQWNRWQNQQWKKDFSWRWECPNSRVGFTPECPATSCKDILRLNPWAPDGKYWMHMMGEEVMFPAWCDMTDGGWTLVWSVPSGVSLDKFGIHTPEQIWWSEQDWDEWRIDDWRAPWSTHGGDVRPKPYKNRFVRKWDDMKISKVRVSIVDNNRPVKTFWFNAEKADRSSWFSNERLTRVWPRWIDLDVTSNKWNNNTAEDSPRFWMWNRSPSDDVRRSWVINSKWGRRCDEAEGWFMAVNDRSTWKSWWTRLPTEKRPCPWEYRWAGRGIHWLYSKNVNNTRARWHHAKDVGVADTVLVWFW